MNHEHEQARANPSAARAARAPGALDPGRASRSAVLRKPDHAVASGLAPRSSAVRSAGPPTPGGSSSGADTTKPAPGRTRSAPSAVVDLLGKSVFEPPAAVAAAIHAAGAEGADVRVKLGKLTETALIRVKKVDGHYVTDEGTPQLVPLTHPLFAAARNLRPVLRLGIGGTAPGAITGCVTLESAPTDLQALQKALIDTPAHLGLRGFSIPTLTLTNRLEAGTLTVASPQPIPFSIGGWVQGQLHLGLVNSSVTFDAHASIRARGLKDGELDLRRDARGNITGSASLGVQLGDKFSGGATATYQNGDVAVKGQLSYHSEKLKGTLHILIADAEQAEQMVRDQIDPSVLAPPPAAGADAKPAPARSGGRAIAGWGDLDFAFTDWVTGKAKVVYGPTGHVTVIGKIAPPKKLDLMPRKGVRHTILPRFNIEAKYGIPYVADVHIGIGVGLAATAGIGPIYMHDLAIEGVYSTDPAVLNRFSITGALHAEADAGLELTVQGYAGVTLLGHSVNAGAEVIGKAGLRGLAEARLTLGYRETAAPTAGKKGEYYLQGHLDMVAQPVLSLSGGLFVEVQSPFWSPLGHKKWQWPIGSLEYPIPAQMGIGADVDYVVGSGKWPEAKLTKPSFDPSRFTSSMMGNKLPSKTGRDTQSKTGSFRGIAPAHPTSAPPSVPRITPPEPQVPTGSPTKKGTGMQSQQDKKNVPASKQVADRWAAGMKALADLSNRAEKDPEDAAGIQAHLAKIKAAHGFTELTAKRNGDTWVVHAVMNPEAKKDIKAKSQDKEGSHEAVYNSIKNAPNYPRDFNDAQDGLKRNTVKNQERLRMLRMIERGDWKMIFRDGLDGNKKTISIHYFEHQASKRVTSVQIKSGWSNPSSRIHRTQDNGSQDKPLDGGPRDKTSKDHDTIHTKNKNNNSKPDKNHDKQKKSSKQIGGPDIHWTKVSRWMSLAEAKVWQGRSSIPQPRSDRIQVTSFGATRPGAASGQVRVDFEVPSRALAPGGKGEGDQPVWFIIFNQGREILIRELKISQQ